MAALTLSSIPSGINTYERLLVWAAQCLQSIANGEQVNVVDNEPGSLLCSVQVANTGDGRDRFVIAAYVPCDRNALNSPTQKTWMAAQDVANTAPHVNLLSN
jgi:hypothetical protein